MVWKVQFLSTDYGDSAENKYIHSYRMEHLILERTNAEKLMGVYCQGRQRVVATSVIIC